MQYPVSVVDGMKCKFYKLFEHRYKGKAGTVEYHRQARMYVEEKMSEWQLSEKGPEQFLTERGLWNLLMKLMPLKIKKR